MPKTFIITILLLVAFKTGFAQQSTIYPRVTGYFSILQPLVTYTNHSFAGNFGNVYIIGFPFGVNILKSDSFGISFEVAPAIRTEKNISKVSTVLFHPGAMFRFKHGFTFIGRMAFETSGRFGVTPVFNQVIKKGKDASFFISVPFPVRFGNDLPASVSTGLQLGVSF
ncbi:hypothetical protein [Mucilaginibacter sp.]|uniref:hypothetical protein n=1 Tax=Mucilaginibacter sp. TaxID=1882438 RepID=UPI002613124F|nr:hypothetical protein [Mucilaginibacter sp.]MDB5129351.1 hypothetical protein [Mucilaginibacter sp.]